MAPEIAKKGRLLAPEIDKKVWRTFKILSCSTCKYFCGKGEDEYVIVKFCINVDYRWVEVVQHVLISYIFSILH